VLPRVCNMMNIFHENDPIVRSRSERLPQLDADLMLQIQAYRFEPWLDERYAHLDPVDLATGAVLRRQNRQTTLMQPHQTVSAVRQSSAVNTICNGARFDFRIPSTLGLLRHVGGEYVSLLKAHNCYWYQCTAALPQLCPPALAHAMCSSRVGTRSNSCRRCSRRASPSPSCQICTGTLRGRCLRRCPSYTASVSHHAQPTSIKKIRVRLLLMQ